MQTTISFRGTLQALTAMLFFASFCTPALGQWQQIYAPQQIDVRVKKYQGAYLTLSANGLYRTTNQGATWEKQPAQLNGNEGFVINPFNLKWYKISSGGIFESSNEGQNWASLNPPTTVRGVQFSRDTVYIQTEAQLFRRVGTNWQLVYQTGSDQISSFCIKDSVIFCARYSGGLYRSGNYGQSWQEIFWNSNEFCHISAKGDTLVCFFFQLNKVYRSYDFGQNWDAATIPNIIQFDDISIQDGLFWGTWNTPGQPYYSFDGLNNWQALPLPPGISGGTSIFQDGDLILLGSNLGAFRSLDMGLTWVLSNNSDGPGQGYSLSYLDGNILNDCLSFLQEGDNVWETPLPKSCRGSLVKWKNLYLSGTTTSHASVGLGLWQPTQTTIPDFRPNIINGILSCEYNGFLHQSMDDGATWNASIVKSPTFDHFPIVGKGSRLWVAGSNFDVAVFRYDTAGQNWPHDALWDIGNNRSFFNYRDTIYLLTQSGPVQYSPDGGQSIVTANKPADYASSGATARGLFVRNGFMVIATEQDKFYVSKDRGQSWIKLPDQPKGTEYYQNTPTVGEHFLYTSTDLGVFAFPLDSIQLNKGIVFLDQNSNGIRDAGEPGLANIKVENVGSGQIVLSGPSGEFSITGNKITDSLRIADLPAGFVPSPLFLIFQNINTPLSFALQPVADATDAVVSLVNMTPFRPGFETLVSGFVQNQGTKVINSQLAITIPPNLEIINISPAPASQTGNTIAWALDDFTPLDIFEVQIVIKTPASASIDALVSISAEVPNPGDLHPGNNTYTLTETIVGSYDPNDKLVSPGQSTPQQLEEEALTYTIRFQNTGSFPTDFVIVEDTISPLLDIASLQLLASSHPVKIKFGENRLVEFIFAPLALAPQAENESGSQGYVRFTIRAIPGLIPGEVISNKALIYFDYNAPVVTNIAGTEIKTVGAAPPDAIQVISINPNPATQMAVLSTPDSWNKPGLLYLYDQLGRQCLMQTTTDQQTSVDCQNLAAGIYSVRWEKEGKLYVGKLVVSR